VDVKKRTASRPARRTAEASRHERSPITGQRAAMDALIPQAPLRVFGPAENFSCEAIRGWAQE